METMSNRRMLINKGATKLTYTGKLTVGVYTSKRWKAYGFGSFGNGIIGAISPTSYVHNNTSFSIEMLAYRTDTSRLYFQASPIAKMLYSFTLNINGIDYSFTRSSATAIPMTTTISNPFITGNVVPIKFSFN